MDQYHTDTKHYKYNIRLKCRRWHIFKKTVTVFSQYYFVKLLSVPTPFYNVFCLFSCSCCTFFEHRFFGRNKMYVLFNQFEMTYLTRNTNVNLNYQLDFY